MTVLTNVATVCGALAVILTFIALVSRLRWIRWAWRHLVSDPLGVWFRRNISEVVVNVHSALVDPRLAAIEKELKTNDGSTLRDAVMATQRTVAAIASDRGMPPGLDATTRPSGA